MLLILFVLLGLSSIAISYLSVTKNSRLYTTINRPACLTVLWAVTLVSMVLLCNSLHTIGLVFNSPLSDLAFTDTLDIGYVSIFIVHSMIAILVIAAYFFLRKICKIPPYWFLIALAILSILLYYPGIPSADGDFSYNQFLQHSFDDSQPPIFTLWWQIFHFKGAAFLAGILLYYSGLSYISYYLHKFNKHWQNHVLIIFSLNPLFFTQLAIIWKDISFVALLVDCVALFLLTQQTQNKKIKIICWIAYFIALFLVTQMRQNGVLAAIPLCYYAIYTILPVAQSKRNLVFSLSGSLLFLIFCILANFFITYKIFAARSAYPQTYVMLSSLAYIECNTDHTIQIDDDFFVSKDPEARDIMCSPTILNYYNYDSFFNHWGGISPILTLAKSDADANKIKYQWLDSIKNYPAEYMVYRAKFFINDMFYPYWYPISQDTPMQNMLFSVAMTQHLDMKCILPILTLCLSISCLFMSIYYRIYSLAFFILLSSIAQLIGWYFLIPAHAARYFMWNYIASILSIILITFEQKPSVQNLNKKNKHVIKKKQHK